MSRKQSSLEFIALMASLMSLAALSIDALLPVLGEIGQAINIKQSNDNQLLVTVIFLGLGFGQLISGPLSDSVGRKPVTYVGFLVFGLASLLCVAASSLEAMVIGRFLQGVGLSAPRAISIATVRDKYSGDHMARIMSFIVVIFILVPVVAPAVGKLVSDNYGWRAVFYFPLIVAVFVLFWYWKRQPETLSDVNRRPLTLDLFVNGYKEFIKYPEAVIFTLISGFISGSFIVYLGASQVIFQEQYMLVEAYPYIFAGLAIAVGFSTFLNGKYVVKYGMYKLVKIFLFLFTLNACIYLLFFITRDNPDVYTLLFFFGLQFLFIGFLMGNLRALAMQPVGHIAGVGSAINGFVSTIMAVPIAIFIGFFIKLTAVPLFVGFFLCGLASLICLTILNKIERRGSQSI